MKTKVREVYEDIKRFRAIHTMNVHHDEQNIDSLSCHSDEEFELVLEGPYVADLGGLTKEGAPHNSQPGSEFPVMSPLSTLQQHSDANAIVSNMVTPSVMDILCSRNSTSEYALALNMISLLKQQLEETNRKNMELEREVQRLRGTRSTV